MGDHVDGELSTTTILADLTNNMEYIQVWYKSGGGHKLWPARPGKLFQNNSRFPK